MNQLPSPPFRAGSTASPARIAFILNAGGIGDYINWSAAIRWAIENHPHISGYIIAPSFFGDLAPRFFADLAPRFEVKIEEIDDYSALPYLTDVPVIVPNRQQYASASSHGLFELGFIYYAQMGRAPAGVILPTIERNPATLERFHLPLNYAVITPNATADNRRLSAAAVNSLIDYFREQALTPVLLGREELTVDYTGRPAEGVSTERTLDLRNTTTLFEAGEIMAGAQIVVGLDNGLLHLAACTTAPIFWIFTSVDPALRLSPRRAGAKNYVMTPPETFTCRFCQSRMRFIFNHDFKNCLYGDNACVRDLTGAEIIRSLESINWRNS